MPLELPTKTALPRNAFIMSNNNQARLTDEAKDKAHASEDQKGGRKEEKGQDELEGGKKKNIHTFAAQMANIPDPAPTSKTTLPSNASLLPMILKRREKR